MSAKTKVLLIEDTPSLARLYAQYLANEPVDVTVVETGHAGMESAFTNLVEPGDSVLVCQHGLWGQRAADMAERQGAEVHLLVKPPGECFTDFKEIQEARSGF